MPVIEEMSGYNKIYRDLLPELAKCDFEECAPRLGLKLVPGGASISFLGRDYLITNSGIDTADGSPIDINFRSVLGYYVISKGRAEPDYSFAPLFRMTGMIDGRNSQDNSLMSGPLEKRFGDDYESFEIAALKLGGVSEESSGGRHIWMFKILPQIPAKVDFYDADEEFPADIQIFLDKTAPTYMEFECLAFMIGCLCHALIKTADTGSTTGWDSFR